MNNILTFAGVTPTVVENGRLSFAKGEDRMSITKLELHAINLWLASMDAHNLPTLLKVGSTIFTVANTTTIPSQEYVALLKATKAGQFGTDTLLQCGTRFIHDEVEMIGNADNPLYLRQVEGACEAVFGYSVTVPNGTEKDLVESVVKDAIKSTATKLGSGSIPTITRQLSTLAEEVHLQTLLQSYERMTVTVHASSMLDDLLEVVDSLMLPVTLKEAA
ncbi:hypothetical protein STRATTON_71 [Erwinia phage vB_EamM_Stratton]|uniref:Uncharacterized protein n=1 Tax=Erwinia phage vB_EamM_Stratton TaxID=1883378 RepID=A0A1B2IGV0_9CAUD|nr:hypothetical protein STRATTON_71 [Erwinia phage vB_EamM_Stratton]